MRFFHARIQYPGQATEYPGEAARQSDNGRSTAELKVAPQGEEAPARPREARERTQVAADGTEALAILKKVVRDDDAHPSR
jgi:hypothetical protein